MSTKLRKTHTYIVLKTFSFIWCEISQSVVSHADTTFSLCLMGLRGQINRHLSHGQTNPHTKIKEANSDTICNDPHPIV